MNNAINESIPKSTQALFFYFLLPYSVLRAQEFHRITLQPSLILLFYSVVEDSVTLFILSKITVYCAYRGNLLVLLSYNSLARPENSAKASVT